MTVVTYVGNEVTPPLPDLDPRVGRSVPFPVSVGESVGALLGRLYRLGWVVGLCKLLGFGVRTPGAGPDVLFESQRGHIPMSQVHASQLRHSLGLESASLS